jgi:hypothetical protein
MSRVGLSQEVTKSFNRCMVIARTFPQSVIAVGITQSVKLSFVKIFESTDPCGLQ